MKAVISETWVFVEAIASAQLRLHTVSGPFREGVRAWLGKAPEAAIATFLGTKLISSRRNCVSTARLHDVPFRERGLAVGVGQWSAKCGMIVGSSGYDCKSCLGLGRMGDLHALSGRLVPRRLTIAAIRALEAARRRVHRREWWRAGVWLGF